MDFHAALATARKRKAEADALEAQARLLCPPACSSPPRSASRRSTRLAGPGLLQPRPKGPAVRPSLPSSAPAAETPTLRRPDQPCARRLPSCRSSTTRRARSGASSKRPTWPTRRSLRLQPHMLRCDLLQARSAAPAALTAACRLNALWQWRRARAASRGRGRSGQPVRQPTAQLLPPRPCSLLSLNPLQTACLAIASHVPTFAFSAQGVQGWPAEHSGRSSAELPLASGHVLPPWQAAQVSCHGCSAIHPCTSVGQQGSAGAKAAGPTCSSLPLHKQLQLR